jgi:uncharacterized protein YdcH (DUF465 family)
MSPLRQQIAQSLLESDNVFKRLFQKHQQLDKQLKDMGKRVYLTAEQESEIHRLKKLKLKNKDEMEAILERHADRNESKGTHTGP